MEVSLFPMKILFVQSTKTNSPMIVTDALYYLCLEATSYEHTLKNVIVLEKRGLMEQKFKTELLVSF